MYPLWFCDCERQTLLHISSRDSLAYQPKSNSALSVAALEIATSPLRRGAISWEMSCPDALEKAAMIPCLIGGGNRAVWQLVPPYGGTAAKLPTNRSALAFPAARTER